MQKKLLSNFMILLCFTTKSINAQTPADTIEFTNQIFAFFENNPNQKRSMSDKTTAYMSEPQWYEIKINEDFKLHKNTRRRYRRAKCYKLNELVFVLDTVKDKQITADWNVESMKNSNMTRLDKVLGNLLDCFSDSLNFEINFDLGDAGIDKYYNEKAYRKQLYIVDEYVPISIVNKKTGSKILLRLMIYALQKDLYELQLVFANYVDDCDGI